LAESNGRLLLGIWRDSLHVTCGLTACTLGSAPGPTLGNEYEKTLPLPLHDLCGITFLNLEKSEKFFTCTVDAFCMLDFDQMKEVCIS